MNAPPTLGGPPQPDSQSEASPPEAQTEAPQVPEATTTVDLTNLKADCLRNFLNLPTVEVGENISKCVDEFASKERQFNDVTKLIREADEYIDHMSRAYNLPFKGQPRLELRKLLTFAALFR